MAKKKPEKVSSNDKYGVPLKIQKCSVTKDDIGAIVSRIDAQTVIMIELLAEINGMDVNTTSAKYRKKYDRMAAKFRKGAVS